MKLVRIAREEWDVLAVVDPRGSCQVVEFLLDSEGTHRAAAKSLYNLLRDRVPQLGPPPGEPLCKHLGDGVYEFRKQPKGKKLRVLWFYGGTSVIVCTAAFTKAERTPRIKIEQLKFLRGQYWAALSRGELEIIDPPGGRE
jgi:phage-related protein